MKFNSKLCQGFDHLNLAQYNQVDNNDNSIDMNKDQYLVLAVIGTTYLSFHSHDPSPCS
jgi:hypothetical protein